MVMNQCALDRCMTRDEQIKNLQEIRSAKPGTRFDVSLKDEDNFAKVQTFFFLSKSPYTLKIQGDNASWIKG